MIRYLVRQVIGLIPLLFLVSMVSFLVMRMLPGDPATAYLNSINAPLTQESIREAEEMLGLDESLPVQYARWLHRALRGDLGYSYETRRPVTEELSRDLGYTACLAGASLIWIVLIAVPLGLLSVKYANRLGDAVIRVITFLGASMPKFWLGFLLIMVFALRFRILPVQGASDLKCLILPSFTMSCSYIAVYTKLLRNSLLDVLSQPYVAYARIRGFGRTQVMIRHVIPNALLPVLTTLGLHLGGILSGAVIVENVFSWPGLGRMCVSAVEARDYPMIQGYILLMAAIFLAADLIFDAACAGLNPRIRLGEER